MPNEPMGEEVCPHKRLYRWISSDGTTFAYCAKCSKKFGPHKTWEEVRIEAGRKPSMSYKDKLIASTLQAAADRACIACGEDMVKFCEKKKGGIKGSPCDTRKAILAPLNKE